ncbi:hypothetical protein BT96DRAFT_1043653 [Gymnopus androsaceus JB14]|uniref:T6SS Phospholipase effector Tle1-like catalytic domain-containing protein n=1 Tax=Gymnopus androsaceus JB14 TaxID=1447944 RepID=A0A6A4HE61_9AGAR|nr:hypothetical protein BT96DRAFT_1043653 [Gymnopus androsaceus JB14]
MSTLNGVDPETDPRAPKEDGCKCNNKRNLVVCIDGTSNKFGSKNTNIVELYSRLVKDDKQLTFYNSGIGTYAEPSWKSVSYWKQVMANKLDLALALRFEKILLDAYRWLSEMYRHGDCIFLFGFSRGAYQVRALAGMIEKARDTHSAYELYARSTDNQPNTEPQEDSLDYMPWRFKTTFSRKNVKVHFVGVWDTVSSIGFVRPAKDLPLTTSGITHVCYFRHALALDERRVKFLPEYAYRGASLGPNSSSSTRPQTKEVWFAGTHSDIGGGNTVNKGLNSYGPALRWMIHEAILAGLHVEPLKLNIEKVNSTTNESLTGFWWIFEGFPIRRLSYKDSKDTTHRYVNLNVHLLRSSPARFSPHMGTPRQVVEGQWIHESAYSNANPADTRIPFKTRLPSSWDGKVDLSKIEKDLYNRVQENLMPLLQKPQIEPEHFIARLNALVEISSSRQSLLIHLLYLQYHKLISFLQRKDLFL